MTTIEALRNYFLNCPIMEDNRINVDYLPEQGMAYSIDITPSEAIVREYTSGGTIRQLLFTIGSVMDYGSDVLQNINNSGTIEQLIIWLEEQSDAGNLPELSGPRKAIKIEALSTGYLFTASPDSGRYQIQCRVLYTQGE